MDQNNLGCALAHCLLSSFSFLPFFPSICFFACLNNRLPLWFECFFEGCSTYHLLCSIWFLRWSQIIKEKKINIFFCAFGDGKHQVAGRSNVVQSVLPSTTWNEFNICRRTGVFSNPLKVTSVHWSVMDGNDMHFTCEREAAMYFADIMI